jgi:hypothetical protein
MGMRSFVLLIASMAAGQSSFDLVPMRPGGRTGQVTVRGSAAGLVVEGRIAGGKPDFADSTDAMGRKDHVEIWIAAASDPVLPPIGWGSQFGMHLCGSKELDESAAKHCPKFTREIHTGNEC